MRVVFAGTPEPALPALEAVAASRHELVGVVTRPDAPTGRGRRLVASPVAQRAEELGVKVLKPEHPRDPEFQAELRHRRGDQPSPATGRGVGTGDHAHQLVPAAGHRFERGKGRLGSAGEDNPHGPRTPARSSGAATALSLIHI